MKKINIYLFLLVFVAVLIATFLLIFVKILPRDDILDEVKGFLWLPKSPEGTIRLKIDGKIRQGIIFKEKIEGFFEARAICLSRNMSLPHKGFEFLDRPVDGIFWIDAYNDQNRVAISDRHFWSANCPIGLNSVKFWTIGGIGGNFPDSAKSASFDRRRKIT